jgi:hypothetical protein
MEDGRAKGFSHTQPLTWIPPLLYIEMIDYIYRQTAPTARSDHSPYYDSHTRGRLLLFIFRRVIKIELPNGDCSLLA